MGIHRINTCFRLLLASLIVACGLMAAEHQGVVKSAGLPVPGATVTVVQGTKKTVTTTDERGAYLFPDLANGVWTIEIEMLGFAKLTELCPAKHSSGDAVSRFA